MGSWQACGNRNRRGQQRARARNAEVEGTEAGDTKNRRNVHGSQIRGSATQATRETASVIGEAAQTAAASPLAWTGMHDETGQEIDSGRDDYFAWSAAFISYVLRTAGAGARFPMRLRTTSTSTLPWR